MELPHMADIPRQSSFNAWYSRNADDFNAKRRQRYHEDPTLRIKARTQAAAYRKAQAEAGTLPEQRGLFNTSARVAALVGISTQTLRNWEARYLIPRATHGQAHRLYTPHQTSLLMAMAEVSDNPAQFAQARRAVFMHWADLDV